MGRGDRLVKAWDEQELGDQGPGQGQSKLRTPASCSASIASHPLGAGADYVFLGRLSGDEDSMDMCPPHRGVQENQERSFSPFSPFLHFFPLFPSSLCPSTSTYFSSPFLYSPPNFSDSFCPLSVSPISPPLPVYSFFLICSFSEHISWGSGSLGLGPSPMLLVALNLTGSQAESGRSGANKVGGG